MEKIEKIEVEKGSKSYYFTGILTTLVEEDEGWVEIKTIRGETLKFRKEQILQRRTVDMNGDDTNGKYKGNKNI